jgi:hypothetical protein
MPRFFFYLATSGDVIQDDVGDEFELIQEARGFALRVAAELARNRSHQQVSGQNVLVVDPRGTVVFRVPLRVEE